MIPLLHTVIFGASRQGVVVLETLRSQSSLAIVGFLDDDRTKYGTLVGGIPVLGGTEWAAANAGQGICAIVAIGGNEARVAVGRKLRDLGICLVNAIHPSATVMAGVTVGTGNLVCAGVVIVTGTALEDDVVVNTGATVDHDSILHSGAYLAPGVHTSGCVTVGRGAFVGVGAVLGPGVTIGQGTIVGAGSVVLSNLPPNTLAYGSPAKVIRAIERPLDWRRILGGYQERNRVA